MGDKKIWRTTMWMALKFTLGRVLIYIEKLPL